MALQGQWVTKDLWGALQHTSSRPRRHPTPKLPRTFHHSKVVLPSGPAQCLERVRTFPSSFLFLALKPPRPRFFLRSWESSTWSDPTAATTGDGYEEAQPDNACAATAGEPCGGTAEPSNPSAATPASGKLSRYPSRSRQELIEQRGCDYHCCVPYEEEEGEGEGEEGEKDFYHLFQLQLILRRGLLLLFGLLLSLLFGLLFGLFRLFGLLLRLLLLLPRR